MPRKKKPPQPPPDPDKLPPITYLRPRPNKMFSPEITALLRFAHLRDPQPCASCGKGMSKMWTMLCPFHSTYEQGLTLLNGPELAPLTLVCDDHPITPTIAILEAL